MSTIRCVYFGGAPSFPATDQHPDAVRYVVGQYVVDALGGEPTPAEVNAVVNRPPIDLSNIDNLEKTFKALALVMRDYCNQLKLGTYLGTGLGGTKTVAEVRADFATKFNALP